MTFLLKNNNYLQKFDKKFAPSHIESGKTLCDGINRLPYYDNQMVTSTILPIRAGSNGREMRM